MSAYEPPAGATCWATPDRCPHCAALLNSDGHAVWCPKCDHVEYQRDLFTDPKDDDRQDDDRDRHA